MKLNSNEISQLKTKILGKYKSLSLLECIEKLKNKSQKIEYIQKILNKIIKIMNLK